MSFKKLKRCLILIDFNNLIWRSFHATEKQNITNDDGINVGCIIGMVKIISQALSHSINKGYKPRIIICEDRYPVRKKNMYISNQELFTDRKPDKNWDGIDESTRIVYKGNRKKKDYPYNPIDICRQYIDCIPHIKIWKDDEEADDVISSFIHKYNSSKIFLYSTDKDLWQLCSLYKNVEIYSENHTSPTIKDVNNKFEGGNYSHIVLYKMLRGDSGDNVKGIYRFPFAKLREEYIESEGNVEKFLSLIYFRYGKDSKEFNMLISNIKLLILNWHLVHLNSDIKFSAKVFNKINRENWSKLCRVFQTRSLLFAPILKLS